MRRLSNLAIRTFALTLALTCAACGHSEAPPGGPSATNSSKPQDELGARLDSIGRAVVASNATPGLTVAVTQGDRVVFERADGSTAIENGRPVTSGTIFRMGSVTKQFTAAAIMRLIEQGQMSLDDSLTRFLPNYPTQGHRITVQHLLNHTSGIRDYTQTGALVLARG